MDRHLDVWTRELRVRRFRSTPTFGESGLVHGLEAILLKAEVGPCGLDDAGRDRLVVLLAVAAGDRPHPDAALHLEAAYREWTRGDKAMATIRLAFAPVARIEDPETAYRLFLAEQALDAGLDPASVLREFGLVACVDLLKYDRYQPRVPKGSGRASGQFGEKPGTSVSDGSGELATVEPAFFDPRAAERLKPPEHIEPLIGPRLNPSDVPGLAIDVAPPPLPLPVPSADPDANGKAGPDCPAMLPDNSSRSDPSGDAEEARVAILVNPQAPTPKRTPDAPGTVAMAYYLATLKGTGVVEYDDCKRANVPSLIPKIGKGDMVEVKTAGSARLIWQKFPGNRAGLAYDKQLSRQIEGIRLEGKGRQLYVCVGNEENASRLTSRYAKDDYKEAHFTVCR